MPSLCIIADTHRLHRSLTIPPCDLLIHCGDFCHFQREDLATLEDVDDWFAALPAKNIVCTGGNHDFPLQRREFRFQNAHYLEDRLLEIEGLTLYGAPWCPDLSGFAYYADDAELIQRWSRIPVGVDILITHTPPRGILDLPTAGDKHLGCPHLRQELRRVQPKLHVFGHVHASHGRHEEDGTVFYNTAIVGGRDYEVRHGPTMHALAAKQIKSPSGSPPVEGYDPASSAQA